jgi:1-deoxy-D-xylulose-5-phosphate reductoisomerase
MRRRVSIFGSTGSVGQNTVALLEAQGGPEAYDVVALSGAQNTALLADQARRLGARIAITAHEDKLDDLRQALAGSGIEAGAGAGALADAAAEPVDWGMSAIVGSAGLAPGLQLARHGGVLALANKESLVCAGALLKRVCAASGTSLVPVDSEHSAIFQVLRGENNAEIARIILTASGGPFRLWSEAQMAAATPDQACAHPNWDMGRRISADSASMFNKALEIIETHELFDINTERIDVVVHPQSIVHSLVEFCDGSLVAQMGPPDMRGPIGFALNWPQRRALPVARLDLAALGQLEFAEADPVRFPALRLARQVLEAGGLSGVVFNAAKEAGLDAFLESKIGFLEMAAIVEHVLEDVGPEAARCGSEYDLETVVALDAAARGQAARRIASISGKNA